MSELRQMSSTDALLRQLVELGLRSEARDIARDNAKKEKKAPRDVETPEQFIARLKLEFKDITNFDEILFKCREHYRIQRKVCRRDTIEKWFMRQRDWQREHGVPNAPEKKRGLVL